MSEEKKNYGYHLSSPISKPIFSAERPSQNGYSMVIPQIFDGNLYLKFTKSITSENKIELSCYLNQSKLNDIANILEGIMARRRDAFNNKQSYDATERYVIPITKFSQDGVEKQVGSFNIDTPYVNNIPRLKIEYCDIEKSESVSIIFKDRVSEKGIEKSADFETIDLEDVSAYYFTLMLKQCIDPSTNILYYMLDSLLSNINKTIYSLLNGRRQNDYQNNGYNRNNNEYNGNSQNSYSDMNDYGDESF